MYHYPDRFELQMSLQNPDQKVGTAHTRVSTLPSPRGHRAALIIVNVQNDFVEPQGPCVVPGGVNTIPIINQLRSKVGWDLIVVTQDGIRPIMSVSTLLIFIIRAPNSTRCMFIKACLTKCSLRIAFARRKALKSSLD